MFLYFVGHLAALVSIHFGHVLPEVGDGGVDGLDRLFHAVAHIQDDSILHAVGLASLFVGQFQVFIPLAEHIGQMVNVSDVLPDAQLHLAEGVLHVANLVGSVAFLHRLIQLPAGHTACFVGQQLQGLQLEMADKEREQGEQ